MQNVVLGLSCGPKACLAGWLTVAPSACHLRRASTWSRCHFQKGTLPRLVGSRLVTASAAEVAAEAEQPKQQQQQQKQKKQQKQQQQGQKQGGGKKAEARLVTPKSEDFSR